MKQKKIKIDAIVSKASCPCGKHSVYNYDKIMNFKERCSVLNQCPECSEKYNVRYNPITKKMYFTDKESGKVLYTYVESIKTTKITKASYDSDYEFSLEELDALDEIAEPAFEIKLLEVDYSQIF